MDTVELTRQTAGYDTLTVSIFTPYHGTELRKLAVQRGYLDNSTITSHTTSSSLLNMPNLPASEIDALMKTFTMYVKFPKEEWPKIKVAESDTDEGSKAFEEYQQKYRNLFFNKTQDETSDDWDDPTEYVTSPKGVPTERDELWGFNCGSEQQEYVVPPQENHS